jgi:hypothetical protein
MGNRPEGLIRKKKNQPMRIEGTKYLFFITALILPHKVISQFD